MQDFRHARRQSKSEHPFDAQIATTIGLMKAGEKTAPTPSNYGYTLRHALRRSLGRALFAEHFASLHFSAAPGHGAILVDRKSAMPGRA